MKSAHRLMNHYNGSDRLLNRYENVQKKRKMRFGACKSRKSHTDAVLTSREGWSELLPTAFFQEDSKHFVCQFRRK